MLEIVGADEIIGDDYLDDYSVGATPRGGNLSQALAARAGGYRQARAAAAGAMAGGAATVVRTERPTESRELVIGLSSLAVAAAATATVTTRPQVLFRPTRLVVGSAFAPSFTIDDIKVGNKSQLIASGSIPAEAFAQTAFNTPMRMDTCQISMDLIVEATNVSAAAADFRAAMFGNAVY
jgi:hypothetical protein